MLLQTKFYIPAPRPNRVSRPRLIARLDEGLHLGRKLTLISAPAGYGKTMLLAEWLTDFRLPVMDLGAEKPKSGWLALDEGDNDPARFLSYVVAALQRATQSAETNKTGLAGILEALQSPKPLQLMELVGALINQIEAIPGTLLLVFDDYHLITAQPVHDAMTFLLEHQPANLHLVIATRADPPLPIARLRARGQLTELRQVDLCFTVEEATVFLNQVMGLELAAQDVRALDTRIEGWIAGLQMVALAGKGKQNPAEFIAAFTGTHRYILDYLLEEVLQRESEQVQSFLLQTSILDRLSGSLCDAILISPHHPIIPSPSPLVTPSQTILEHLEHTNLFIVPLDDQRVWYRYHRLFSDLLRQRLHKMYPEGVVDLHRRAAAWYVTAGDIGMAIHHALEAGDIEQAADWISQEAEATLMRGEVVTLWRWLDALPDAVVCTRPMLCVFNAWMLLISGQPLEVVEARLQDAAVYSDRIPGALTALRALIAAYRIQVDEAMALSHLALEQLPEENRFLRSFVTWILSAYAAAYRGPEAAGHLFNDLIQQGLVSGNRLVAVIALNHLAESHARHGNLHQAWQLYERALDIATDEQGHRLSIAGQVLAGMGDVACAWYDVARATRCLLEGIALIELWNEVGALESYLALAWLNQVQGREKDAQLAVDKARVLAIKFDVTKFDDWVVDMLQARLYLMQDNVSAAQHWAEARGLYPYIEDLLTGDNDTQPEYRLRKYELVVLARLFIAQEQPGLALKVLEAVLPVAERQRRPALIIEIHLLEASALARQGQRDRALIALMQALTLAESEAYMRPFVDVGPLVRSLIADFGAWIEQRKGITEPERLSRYAEKVLAVLDGISYIHEPNPPKNQEPKILNLIESLSERELDVLRLLPSALSTTEMAEELYVSVHTVRSHLKNIYSKLDVHSRYEAVAEARTLGLL
ncbi:MAG: hypothetical protein JXA33_16260 [Anaerolineae bacterium]|nr:hypothetical protein [Anaerolineae bacterium]